MRPVKKVMELKWTATIFSKWKAIFEVKNIEAGSEKAQKFFHEQSKDRQSKDVKHDFTGQK